MTTYIDLFSWSRGKYLDECASLNHRHMHIPLQNTPKICLNEKKNVFPILINLHVQVFENTQII